VTNTTTPSFTGIDHIHVHVADRAAAEAWYASVLGLTRAPQLAFWATGGGPLTLADASGSVHLALFEHQPLQECRSTIALGATAAAFMAWRARLALALGRELALSDHEVSWSIYFADPDGNPFEITTYEYDAVKALRAA
jgi:catechol-2,3-dioxygenase